ncbi:predicted protein [Arabidopsis lyrata subsp. lyrata]|uniref:Predicted protein n=1 Tax=Arabidopsis lyrata subsp. lyrata TaxID=81972 RepID=D7MW04_ARALL|nr:predicted protein [Arabidopsis lyrata subsp. lyrata]
MEEEDETMEKEGEPMNEVDDIEGEWCKPKNTIRRTMDKTRTVDTTKTVKVFLDLDTTEVPEDDEQVKTLKDQIEKALQTRDQTLTVGEICCFGLDEPPNKVRAPFLHRLGYKVTLNPRRVEYYKKKIGCRKCHSY